MIDTVSSGPNSEYLAHLFYITLSSVIMEHTDLNFGPQQQKNVIIAVKMATAEPLLHPGGEAAVLGCQIR